MLAIFCLSTQDINDSYHYAAGSMMETESGSLSFFLGELNKLERFFSHVSVYRDVAHVYRCFRGLLRVDNAYGVR